MAGFEAKLRPKLEYWNNGMMGLIEKAQKIGGFDDEDVSERASYGGFEP
jgi:hypothetical protein